MTTASPGIFVVIEGIDGSGTTTQARLLADWLREKKIECRLTAEPTDGPVGKLIRQILRGQAVSRDVDGKPVPVHNDVISMLFAADRLDHVYSLIAPCLQQGIWVVSDRYYHSSLTYQALEGDWNWIRQLNSRAPRPQVTYVLDCPVEVSWQRLMGRCGERELYEKEQLQLRLAEVYRRLPERLGEEEIVLVDGVPPPEEVHRQIVGDLSRRFGC